MPSYVVLLNWTDKGISSVKETIQRADSAAELAQQHGGSLQVYWTVGAYDLVAILEAPDDESATAFLLQVGTRGPEGPQPGGDGSKEPGPEGPWLSVLVISAESLDDP